MLLLSSVMVISVRNPVHSVLFLIFSFFNAAALFVLLGAEFIAMTLVIVYVGAVAVLFLFVVMMLHINIAQVRQGFIKNLPLGVTMGVIIALQLYIVLTHSAGFLPAPHVHQSALELTNTEMLGLTLYTDYFINFQAAGIILLVAMIGAIVLTLEHGKDAKRQNITRQVMRDPKDCVDMLDPGFRKGVKL